MTDQKTILIAEDEAATLKVFTSALEEAGFRVLAAVNGQEALDKALSKHPDLILLDIQMPVMDGLTMLEKLREDEWGKTAEVVLLTNFSDTEKIAHAIKNQAFEYLIKSDYEVDDIVARVQEKLK